MAQSTGKLSPVQDTDDTEHGIMHRMDNENMSTVERDMTAVTVCFIYTMYLLDCVANAYIVLRCYITGRNCLILINRRQLSGCSVFEEL